MEIKSSYLLVTVQCRELVNLNAITGSAASDQCTIG